MKQIEAEGYILSRYKVNEADSIYSFFSKEYGKIRFIAKGIRKAEAKLSGQMQPFARIKIRLVYGRNLNILVGAQIMQHFDLLSASLEAVAVGYRICEMLSRCLAEDQPSPAIFTLLEESCEALLHEQEPQLVNLYFSVRLLHFMGSQPNFEDIKPAVQYYLDYDTGNITGLRPSSHYGIVPEKVIKLWRIVLADNITKLQKIQNVEELLAKANLLIEKHYEYHYHVQFRSKQIV